MPQSAQTYGPSQNKSISSPSISQKNRRVIIQAACVSSEHPGSSFAVRGLLPARVYETNSEFGVTGISAISGQFGDHELVPTSWSLFSDSQNGVDLSLASH